ncbi:MAG: response regulator transcription factor [Rubrivivax sp.]|nr:response regulator transcription factor [Rubrivivax sp.]
MSAIRVYVVDDHPMIRHGLCAMLAGRSDVQWVGDAAGAAEAAIDAPPRQPDITLVDLLMPRMDGVETIRALRPLLPQTRFVVLAGSLGTSALRRATAAGASGFLLKTSQADELLNAIRRVHRGEVLPTPPLDDGVDDAPSVGTTVGADLTQRERELLALMARGLSNQDIAKSLGIAMPTVKFHVTNILAKLHADNRTEAVLTALKLHLVMLE